MQDAWRMREMKCDKEIKFDTLGKTMCSAQVTQPLSCLINVTLRKLASQRDNEASLSPLPSKIPQEFRKKRSRELAGKRYSASPSRCEREAFWRGRTALWGNYPLEDMARHRQLISPCLTEATFLGTEVWPGSEEERLSSKMEESFWKSNGNLGTVFSRHFGGCDSLEL